MSYPIVLEGGKYTLIHGEGQMKALRYGEEWRDLTGDKLFGAMVSRIVELVEENGQEVVRMAMENDQLRQRVKQLEELKR
jgi:hypothetical protein